MASDKKLIRKSEYTPYLRHTSSTNIVPNNLLIWQTAINRDTNTNNNNSQMNLSYSTSMKNH